MTFTATRCMPQYITSSPWAVKLSWLERKLGLSEYPDLHAGLHANTRVYIHICVAVMCIVVMICDTLVNAQQADCF